MSKQKPRQEIPKNKQQGTHIKRNRKTQYLCSINING